MNIAWINDDWDESAKRRSNYGYPLGMDLRPMQRKRGWPFKPIDYFSLGVLVGILLSIFVWRLSL